MFSCGFLVAAIVLLGGSHASAGVIFGADQNGDFGGDIGDDLTANHTATSTNATRRAIGGTPPPDLSYFYENIDFTVTSVDGGGVFGGIDQLGGDGNPKMFANKRTVTQATFFANAGDSGTSTAPSGTFSQAFIAGDVIGYSFDAIWIDNSSDARGTTSYALSMSFDGGSNFLELVSLTADDISGAMGTIEGTFEVPTNASDFLVRASITNPGPGNDQAGIDNIVLVLNPVPEPGAVAMLVAGLGFVSAGLRRRGC